MENSGKNIEYSELICRSNFSFLKGGSSPEEIIERAKYLGYKSIAITDEVSVSGLVRAHKTAKQNNIKLICGSQFWVKETNLSLFYNLILLVKNKTGWKELCKLITVARKKSEKNFYYLTTKTISSKNIENCFALLLLPSSPLSLEKLQYISAWLQHSFKYFALAYSNNLETGTTIYQKRLLEFSNENNITVTATSNVCISHKSLKPLLDVLTSIRLGVPLNRCGYRISKNSEQYLREKNVLSSLYIDTFLQNSIYIQNECNFSLDEITYNYPTNLSPKNIDNKRWLKYLVKKGIKKREVTNSQEKVPIRIFRQILNELKIISQMKYECYFLTVYDIVSFAKSRNILCQGRGSAANSAVCYYLGITEVDPIRSNMLFARFLSKERNEPPDIDIDFEHKRREEVI
ncbi:MAG: PHP domain-containing protein, partial [Burkholderiaceae bacterium]